MDGIRPKLHKTTDETPVACVCVSASKHLVVLPGSVLSRLVVSLVTGSGSESTPTVGQTKLCIYVLHPIV